MQTEFVRISLNFQQTNKCQLIEQCENGVRAVFRTGFSLKLKPIWLADSQ